MNYWIWLESKRRGPYIYKGSILPGLLSERLIEQTACENIERLKICDKCDGAIAHVIETETGRKFCPVMFFDLLSKTIGAT